MPSRLRRPAPWLAAAGVAVLAVLAVVLWRVFAEPEVYPPARVLRFPEAVPSVSGYWLELSDAPIGASPPVVRVWPGMAGLDQPAIGEIPVPRGVWATLVIVLRGGDTVDYSYVRDLGEDDLQGLFIMRIDVSAISAPREEPIAPPPSLRAATLVERIKRLSGLRYLGIVDIDDEGLKHLSELDQLTWLEIASDRITESGLNRLRAALPNCTINDVKGVPGPENRRPIG